MPVTITGDSPTQWIEGLSRAFNSPDLIQELGQALSEDLIESFHSSGLQSRSGATVEALSVVNAPERTATGWKIGVGDSDALGDENTPAPRGTLREFFNDYMKAFPGQIHPSAWRGIPRNFQSMLEAERRSGMYGGRGPKYANYAWIQNRGNPKAYIAGTGFIDKGVAMFQSRAPQIIESWWSSLGTAGRLGRRIAGIFGR